MYTNVSLYLVFMNISKLHLVMQIILSFSVPPTFVGKPVISPIPWVNENTAVNVVCTATFSNTPDVSSLNCVIKDNGRDRTGSGSMNPSTGVSNTVTYTTQIVAGFSRADTPSIKCEVIWEKDKPGIKQTTTSDEVSLNVYCKHHIFKDILCVSHDNIC